MTRMIMYVLLKFDLCVDIITMNIAVSISYTIIM